MNNTDGRTDINPQVSSDSPHSTGTVTASTANAATYATSFNFPGNGPCRFPLPNPAQSNFQTTGAPIQPLFPSSVPASYPPYMNYAYSPFHNLSSGFPLDTFSQYASQPSSSRLQLLAPKPPQTTHVKSAGSSQGQPPAFIETVQNLRKLLYQMGGLSASDEPLAEGTVYSKWRKAVIDTWKPVSLFLHFICTF